MKHHPGLVILDAHATVQHCRGCYYFAAAFIIRLASVSRGLTTTGGD